MIPENYSVMMSLNWNTLDLSAVTLKVIEEGKFLTPTPVQAASIPPAMLGADLIVSAQTGSGKTASFVIPIVERLKGTSGTSALILAPTREIAQQIQATFEIFAKPHGLRSACLIGGVDYSFDEAALKVYPEVLIGTPGRVCDHIEKGNLWLDYLKFFVLDEADRMLDMGFSAQIGKVLVALPENRQTLLYSATISPEVERLSKKILKNPERISTQANATSKPDIKDEVWFMDEENKMKKLYHILTDEKGSIIVFTRSKDTASRLWRSIHSRGFHESGCLHSDLQQKHREQALEDFKTGKARILVATDVAARGLHISEVKLIVNYDLPLEAENYVHRIGRTGRAGQSGTAITLATPRDGYLLTQIEKEVDRVLPKTYFDGLKDTDISYKKPEWRGNGGGGSRGGSGGGPRSGGGGSRPGGSRGGPRR